MVHDGEYMHGRGYENGSGVGWRSLPLRQTSKDIAKDIATVKLGSHMSKSSPKNEKLGVIQAKRMAPLESGQKKEQNYPLASLGLSRT